MKCPRCDAELSSKKRESVIIDFCPSCKGTWVGPTQLNAMIKDHETQFPKPQVEDALKHAQSAVPPAEQINLVACPYCESPMRAVNYNYSSGVIVNVCAAGHGVWFDNGELERVEIFMEHWDAADVKHDPKLLNLAAQASAEESLVSFTHAIFI